MAAIIIVDDDPTVRAIAVEFLRDGDHAIVEAADGHEALRILKAVPIDLMVLDIALPELDGLDVLQILKREHPRLPVLMLSTYPEKQYAVRCIRLGASGYLNKSADPDDMLAAVRKVAMTPAPFPR